MTTAVLDKTDIKEKAKRVLEIIKENNLKMVDFRYTDMLGTWQHFSVPVSELSLEAFEDGFGFDGSSIRGWQAINNSDMLLLPDPDTAVIDPFYKTPTIALIGNIYDPITRERYIKDPRGIAQKAEAYLKSTGIANGTYFGPEAEFFIFNNIRYDYNDHEGYYHIDSDEASWNSGRCEEGKNLGYKIRHKEGYYPISPLDTLQDIRAEMVLTMQKCGIDVECQHHEVATAGQCEIDMRFNKLTKMADNVMMYKYVVKNVAKVHNMTATFMPKPLYGDNGSGMHCHQSLWYDNKPLFAGNAYAGMSEMALYYIGGILKHAKALTAITNPTVNSYKRLVPGYEAPVNLAYSSRNRSASIRIPMYSANPKAKRIEVRFPDPATNPYLAFSAMLLAGLDGIQNKITPGDPIDKNLYDLPPEEAKKIKTVPASLDEALISLENDHEFLLKGDVFPKELIETWIEYKRENEIDPVRLRPHPYEYHLYYDA